ncbi:MAG TPA: DUF5011 domain-containing protein [Candidatus Babeliaceae bacterium]|jgi:hypothetical protein|nr:DUF5011 domain-containing protein [Candidatus Babeliaceae bacterium]
MERHTKLLAFIFAVLAIIVSSCKKDITDTESQVGISKVTNYADITLKGDRYASIVKGGTFTDPGAEATEKGNPIDVKVSGTVDANTVGVYNLTYSAVNSDGFTASATRTVAVLPEAEQSGVDISGSYTYVATGTNKSTITKIAPGFYSTNNCWGTTNIPCLFICVDGENIIIPSQLGGYGEIYGSGTITSSGALTYSVNLPAYGYADIIRKWQKD